MSWPGSPTGVAATHDTGALPRAEARLHLLHRIGRVRYPETVDDFCRILEAGINVVTTSVPGLLYPHGSTQPNPRGSTARAVGGASAVRIRDRAGFLRRPPHAHAVDTSAPHRVGPDTKGDLRVPRLPGDVHDVRVFGFREATRASVHVEIPRRTRHRRGDRRCVVADKLGVKLDEVARPTTSASPTALEIAAGTIPRR